MNNNIDITKYLDSNGLIKTWPSKQQFKQEIIKYLATKFEEKIIYNEKQINEILTKWHTFNDITMLRRSLIDYGYLGRTKDGREYWKICEENKMVYKAFKDIKLSRLGMGNMRLPVQKDVEKKPIDYTKAREIIDYGMSHGITYFDTAYVYHNGESEKFLGDELVSRYDRKSFYIATKYYMDGYPDYKAVFEEQLSRLKTDYIDFYLLHAMVDGNYQRYIDCGCIDYFLEQKAKGRIKYLGFSSHASSKVLEIIASHHDWDFAQIQLNYYDWKYSETMEEYKVLEKHNIPIIVMEPVRGGRLADLSSDAEKILKERHNDWTIPSWAFRFVKSLPQVQVILSGMSTLDQIKDNVHTFESDSVLDEEDMNVLFKACEVFKKQIQVPCTACRYCTPNCPVEINIPEVLKVYNEYKIEGLWALNGLKRIESKGMPKDCIGCEACKKHCPQGIDITGIMKEIASLTK